MNIRSHHISFTKLTDLAENRLLVDERTSLLAHLSACSRCPAQLARVERVIGLMRTDTAEDAPREAITQAVSLFRSRPAVAEPSVVRRIVAALSFDSRGMSPALGMRSGQTATRQLLYSAGENDLDLRVTPSGETWIISGQVLGQCTGGEVELGGAHHAAQTELNELCEFTLAPVPTGRYTLRLRLTGMEIEVPEIELRA